MTIISQMLSGQGLGAGLTMSQEEFEAVETELLEELPEESEDIDDEFDQVEQTEEAAASLESMAEMISSLPGLSVAAYGNVMKAANHALGAAGIYSQVTALSTEDEGEATDAERKDSAADRLKARAGGLKDAVIQTIRKLIAVIKGFFNTYFDRVERMKRGAISKLQSIKDGATIKVSMEWARQFTKMRELQSVSEAFGNKAIDAIKGIKAGGDSTNAFEKLSSLRNHSFPSGLIGNPRFEGDTGKLMADFPANNGGSTQAIDSEKAKDALKVVIRVCDDLLKQRASLKGTALTADEKALSKASGTEASAESFSKSLKLVNGIYKGWCTYVAKVCQGVVSAISAASAPAAEKPAE